MTAAFRKWPCVCVVTALMVLGPICFSTVVGAQEKSVNPGINERFENPDVDLWLKRFESDDRDVYRNREKIVAEIHLEPGMDVADIGAGTGFFTVLFAQRIGPKGTAYAVDIARSFVDHVMKTAGKLELKNIKGIVNPPDATGLPEDSIDVAFICDTYHHFEYPAKMLKSVRKSLRPEGILVIIDFDRIEGVTREFILDMVRADRETFKMEIRHAGFDLISEASLSDEQYILKFRKSR
ncbi:MAG: class I SAM-dependent methyltransferase [Acidobacteriota bacterium]